MSTVCSFFENHIVHDYLSSSSRRLLFLFESGVFHGNQIPVSFPGHPCRISDKLLLSMTSEVKIYYDPNGTYVFPSRSRSGNLLSECFYSCTFESIVTQCYTEFTQSKELSQLTILLNLRENHLFTAMSKFSLVCLGKRELARRIYLE